MLLRNTGIEFRYDPTEAKASTRQITLLLEGLGYDQATCVHDDDSGMIVVCGQKFGQGSLDENEHEVSAICNVLGQWVDIHYAKLSATEKLTYTKVGDWKFQKLDSHRVGDA
jgi:hypothetical protein